MLTDSGKCKTFPEKGHCFAVPDAADILHLSWQPFGPTLVSVKTSFTRANDWNASQPLTTSHSGSAPDVFSTFLFLGDMPWTSSAVQPGMKGPDW